jgi:hypothetical protein
VELLQLHQRSLHDSVDEAVEAPLCVATQAFPSQEALQPKL